jgi:hypothetical protein
VISLIAVSATYFEVGAAASIHPESVTIAPPRATKNAGGAAALANQSNFSLSDRAFGAIMAFFIAGLAIECLRITAPTASACAWATIVASAAVITATIVTVTAFAAGRKIGATAAIDPDAVSVIAPCLPLDAGIAAVLLNQPDAAADIDGAIVTSPIIRGAINLLALRSRVGNIPADEKDDQQDR